VSQTSKIEWTDASWNPSTGCRKVSPGCKNCYAERFAERFRGVKGNPFEQGFDIKLWPQRIKLPLTWKKARMVFVDSMSDLFLKEIPSAFIKDVFNTMTAASWHTFQLLTKRSERMAQWTIKEYDSKTAKSWPQNVWLGVTVEDEKYLCRLDDLRKSPAEIRFVSFEPLLGKLNLKNKHLKGIDWVIVGGESGPFARPMEKEWVDEIYNVCKDCGVSFFFKQWGAFNEDGLKVGKKKAGRLFKNRFWNEMPIKLN
jgi:protein gp37